MEAPGPERSRALRRLGIAAVLLLLTFAIPRMARLFPELSARYGLDKRGESRFEITGTSVPGTRLGLEYEGGGYVYLWVVEVGPDGLSPILPRAPGPTTWGHRTAPGGERIDDLIEVTEDDRVVLGLLSPVPVRFQDLEARAEAARRATPRETAKAMKNPGGQRFVRLISARQPRAHLDPQD